MPKKLAPKPLVLRSTLAAELLKRLQNALEGRKAASGKGFSWPVPNSLGGGGLILLSEDAGPEVMEHEQEHINRGWDDLAQSLVDTKHYVMEPYKDLPRPFEPIPTGIARGMASEVPQEQAHANYNYYKYLAPDRSAIVPTLEATLIARKQK